MPTHLKPLIPLGIFLGSLGIGYIALAWTAPTGTPPNNNVAAPINVSGNAQSKTGNLYIGASGSSAFPLRVVGSGIDTSSLYVDGGTVFAGNPSVNQWDSQYFSTDTAGSNTARHDIGGAHGWDSNMLYINGWGDWTSGVSIGGPGHSSNLTVNGSTTTNSLCLNGSCRSDWSQASQWQTNGTSIYYNGGNVGIGISNPYNALHVAGAIGATQWVGAGCETNCETGGGYAILYPSGFLSLNGYNINSPQTSYGTIALTTPYNGYYGTLYGTGTGNANVMYDGAGNGGIYYQNWGWEQYYLTSTRHLNINTSIDLGSALGVSGDIRATNNIYASSFCIFNGSCISSWPALLWQQNGSSIYYNNGNVGIGTASPSYKFQVFGGHTSIGNGSDNFTTGHSGNAAGWLELATDGVVRTHLGSWAGDTTYIMKDGGNVGIGTVSPGEKLDVSGGNIRTTGAIYSTGNQIFTTYPGGYAQTALNQWGLSSTGTMYLEPAGGQTLYLTDSWSRTGTLDMEFGRFLFLGGSVGIGGSPSSGKLEVIGNNTETPLTLRDTYSGGQQWNFLNGATYTYGGGHQGELIIGNGIPGSTFAEKIRITPGGNVLMNGGNVGIGTGSPNYKLDVEGGGAYGYGGLRIGYQSFNSHNNGWLYLGDSNGAIYGGQGLAAGNLWASSNSYASQFCIINGSCISSWPGGTITGVTAGTNLTGGGTSGNVTLNTSMTPTFNEVYANGWLRNNNSLTGLYNSSNGNHIYSESPNYWTMTSAGSSTGGLIFRDQWQSTLRGYVYHDTSGFGLLNSAGNWAVRANPGSTELFGTAYANGGTICASNNNCGYATSSSAITGSGSTNYIAKFTGGTSLGNSLVTDDGTTTTHSGAARFIGYGTDSWFPYVNGVNYLRGNLQFNGTLYDEDNNTYYINPDSTSIYNDLRANNFYDVQDTRYGFLGANVYANTINTGIGGDPLEINYYRQGNVNIGTGPAGGSNLTVGGNIYASGSITSPAYNPLNFTYAGYSTPNGTFRLTPNVHINTPPNFGVIINWDNGATGDSSVGQFVVANGAGSSIFSVFHNGNICLNGSCISSWPGGTITGVTAGTNLTGGGTSGNVRLDVSMTPTFNDIYANNWFRVNSTGGIYWQSYGGGWFMQDGTWLRTYNNASVWAGLGTIATGGSFSSGYGGTGGPSGGAIFAGNVGIGTASPGLKLDVHGDIAVYNEIEEITTNANAALYLNYRGYNGGTTQFRDLWIGNGKNSNVMFVQGSTGNVGIGTAGPSQKLDVVGGYARSDTGFCIGGSCITSWPVSNSGTITGVTAGNNLTGGGTSGTVTLNVSQTPTFINAYLSPNGELGINGSGDVSWSSYGVKLYAYDSSWIRSNTGLQAAGNISNTSSSNTINSYGPYQFSTWDIIKNPSSALIAFGGVTPSQYSITALYTSGTERMRIDSSGNVGIGTAGPGYKLDIAFSGDNWIRLNDSTYPTKYAEFGLEGGVTKILGNNNDIAFRTDGGGWSDKVTIKNNGNVQIGSTGTHAILSVNGAAINTRRQIKVLDLFNIYNFVSGDDSLGAVSGNVSDCQTSLNLTLTSGSPWPGRFSCSHIFSRVANRFWGYNGGVIDELNGNVNSPPECPSVNPNDPLTWCFGGFVVGPVGQ